MQSPTTRSRTGRSVSVGFVERRFVENDTFLEQYPLPFADRTRTRTRCTQSSIIVIMHGSREPVLTRRNCRDADCTHLTTNSIRVGGACWKYTVGHRVAGLRASQPLAIPPEQDIPCSTSACER